MRNIKLLLSYDGTDFSGWQRQHDRRTVQQVLEEAIGRLTAVVPVTSASGRTDAGVHALGQVVHFYTASRHAPGKANPEGLAAVYEVGGREYVAFCASGMAQANPDSGPNLAFTPGKVEAQGYYVFALPKGTRK